MDEPLCKLTIVSPPPGAERIIELMLDNDVMGFTTWTAEGHGFGFAAASASERVRGRVKRTVITVILRNKEAAFLIAEIAEKAALPHLTYWTEAISSFGHMQRPLRPRDGHGDETSSIGNGGE